MNENICDYCAYAPSLCGGEPETCIAYAPYRVLEKAAKDRYSEEATTDA